MPGISYASTPSILLAPISTVLEPHGDPGELRIIAQTHHCRTYM